MPTYFNVPMSSEFVLPISTENKSIVCTEPLLCLVNILPYPFIELSHYIDLPSTSALVSISVPNVHPMNTRAKSGFYKPRIYIKFKSS